MNDQRVRSRTLFTGNRHASQAICIARQGRWETACYVHLLAAVTVGLLLVSWSQAGDWPTVSLNPQRNAFSNEGVDAARLELAWTYESANPPSTAWHGPAKWDAYNDVRMHSMRNYDEVFQTISVGEHVYLGSSVEDAVICLNATSGEQQWSFVTDGPIRIAPTYSEGRLYFGSDDGYAYCISATDGSLVWKFRPQESERLVLNNGRFIPLHPIRSGVTVVDGVAYFASSLLPWDKSYLCAVDADTGSAEGEGLYVQSMDNMTFEGPLAVSPRLVIAPQGRVPPVLFERSTGKQLGALKGGGGSFVVVLPNQDVVHGPGNKAGEVSYSSSQSREKLASHNNAQSLVLNDSHTFVLANTSLSAIDQANQKEIWRVPCAEGLSLIGVGENLFVGKADRVEAYAVSDGSLLWAAPVAGKVFGLSFAGNRLLVSTDQGHIYAYSPTATEPQAVAATAPVKDRTPQSIDPADLAVIEKYRGKGLLGHWVFQPPFVRGFTAENLAEGKPASIEGMLQAARVGDYSAIELLGAETSITISQDLKEAKVPKQAMTAEAWVRIDKPQQWGGIIGAIQDNGDDEKGWLLGYRDNKFSIGLAGEEANGRLTYLSAAEDFTVGGWHHVAATYDGQKLNLFVDGKLSASSDEQRGPIRYPDEATYIIGAYRDKDEHFPMVGMIHEVRVYDRALAAAELRKHYREKAKRFPPPAPVVEKPKEYQVAVGPWLQFVAPGEAVIRWQTERSQPTRLSYRLGDDVQQVEQDGRRTQHEVRLSGLKRKRLYHYKIELVRDGEVVYTPEFECDTFFDYTLPVAAKDATDVDEQISNAARSILEVSQVRQGMCLLLNAQSCQLAEELVKQSELRVLCLCSNEADAAAAWNRLRAAGLYGARVVVRVGSLPDELQLTPYWANLVVSESTLADGQVATSLAQVRRSLAPTGVAVLGALTNSSGISKLEQWVAEQNTQFDVTEDSTGKWVALRGVSFDGAGDWSYIYGGANNSAYGGESLAGARNSEDLEIQWLGRPGPRYQADRNGRKTPPISFGGRLFLEGLHRIVALDIYNGAVAWSLEVPNFQRFNIPRDTANWCGEGDSLFAAVRDRCWRINTADGQVTQIYTLPKSASDQQDFDWGYIAAARGLVLGSAVKQGSSYSNFWGSDGWYDSEEGPATFKVCSDAIFAADKYSGEQRWSHSEGLIINSTITMSDNRMFFVEGRDPQLMSAGSRRLNSPELWQNQRLVALDIETGKIKWEVPLDTVDGTVVFYMAHSADKLVIVASSAGKFNAYCLDDSNGKLLWEKEFPWGAKGKADHGSHLSRPAIVGDRVFVRPVVLDLATGEIRDEQIPEGKCGTYSCTDSALFFRGNPGARFAMWSMNDNQYSLWNRLRTDCWLSTIPSGGMLLSPEGGGGCSCGSWMETSIGFIPGVRLNP